mmetsp:Transcript_25569/g.71501  ORF Transcript_25569/g.71501 Transcript_25569/m.71501 type:complete len:200 (+) Transcript_25569:223-822(+)
MDDDALRGPPGDPPLDGETELPPWHRTAAPGGRAGGGAGRVVARRIAVHSHRPGADLRGYLPRPQGEPHRRGLPVPRRLLPLHALLHYTHRSGLRGIPCPRERHAESHWQPRQRAPADVLAQVLGCPGHLHYDLRRGLQYSAMGAAAAHRSPQPGLPAVAAAAVLSRRGDSVPLHSHRGGSARTFIWRRQQQHSPGRTL